MRLLVSLALAAITTSMGVASAQQPANPSACGAKTYCTDMAACSEAYYYFSICGLDDLDRDGDGVPCETLCGKTVSAMKTRIDAKPFIPAAPVNAIAGDGKAVSSFAPVDEAAFTCGKRTCGQMDTCEEATFHLEQCGVKSLDRDHDGTPCETLCGN